MPEIALSSTCFSEKNLEKLCRFSVDNEIYHIELSGNLEYMPLGELVAILKKYRSSIKFYIHNYYPPPQTPITLNLAHKNYAKESIKVCKNSIDLCAELEMPVYSIHAGTSFAFEPKDFGNPQMHLPCMNFGDSRKLFIDSCLHLYHYAKDRNITLLIENSVVANGNVNNSHNDRYHFSDLEESKEMNSLFEENYFKILLDVGHLKVSAQTLRFDPAVFIEKFRKNIWVVHLSENDGQYDTNLPITDDSWFWSSIPWKQLKYISLEVSNQPIEVLKEQIQLVTQAIL